MSVLPTENTSPSGSNTAPVVDRSRSPDAALSWKAASGAAASAAGSLTTASAHGAAPPLLGLPVVMKTEPSVAMVGPDPPSQTAPPVLDGVTSKAVSAPRWDPLTGTATTQPW